MSGQKPPDPLARRVARRRLTAEEEHLWSAVARTIEPLRPGRKSAPRHRSDAARPVELKAVGAPTTALRRHRAAAAAEPVTIGRRERQDLARGRAAVAARIDLHGMTQAEAHGALLRFLHRAQANGAKFVLVITGKGARPGMPESRGILRRQVPLWLALPEFRGCVLGFDVAAVGHGGEGALYVRLRKSRR
jgi:DNA-nicking Smr family endonuclease